MIISRQNAFIKQIRSLADKKFRDELNLYIAEGVKMVSEAIFSGQTVKAVVGTAKGLSQVAVADLKTEEVSEDVFKSISGEVSPQGVLAVIEKPSEKPYVHGSCVFLDGVKDPANVGAVIRTAAASGYDTVYLCETADPYGPKAVRASMSGIYKVNAVNVTREEFAKSNKLPVVIADMNGENVFDIRLSGDVCIVIGSEGKGVSDFMRGLADKTVSIPMENGMESLNASVSAGILMYALKNRGRI